MKASRDQELDLIAGLDRCHGVISAAFRELFSHIRESDRAELWREDGCRDMAEWLAGRFGISVWHASRWVKAAHKLEDLPLIARAFHAGKLSVDKVVELTRYATADTEASLIAWATKVRPATIRHQADLATALAQERAGEAEGSRYLTWWWDTETASLGIEGRLPAHEGTMFIKAIDVIAKDLPQAPDPQAPMKDALDLAPDVAYALTPNGGPLSPTPAHVSLEQRRADALALLAGAKLPSCRADDGTTLVVHVDLADLGQDGRGCAIEGGPVASAELARRLSCDCSLEMIIDDGDKMTIGIKRRSRQIPRWLRRQMLHRDGGCCLFPGCDQKNFLKGHHIVPWPDGPTNLDNLASLCPFHHKLIHQHRWSMKLGAISGTAQWSRPDGSHYNPQPTPREIDRAPPHPQLLPPTV